MLTGLKSDRDEINFIYIISGLFIFALLFAALGEARPYFFDIDEPKYITAALEMAKTGDWWHPMFGGLPRMQKPPLPYWLTAPLFKWLGTNFSSEALLFIARIPAVFASAMCVAATCLIGKRLFNTRTAVFAALFLAICPAFKFEGLMLKADIIYTAAVTWASYFYIRRFQGDRSFITLCGATFALMLGVLTKGPFALPSIGGYFIAEMLRNKQNRTIFQAAVLTFRKEFLPVAMGAVIGCGPFLIWVYDTGKGGMDYSTGMLSDLFANSFYKGNPFIFYFRSLSFYVYEMFLVFFPLGGFALISLFFIFRDTSLKFDENKLVLWTSILYLLLCLVLFRLRAHRYFLPVLPFLSLISVHWVMNSVKDLKFKKLCILGAIPPLLTALVCSGLALYSGKISINLWQNFETVNYMSGLLPFAVAAILVGILVFAVCIIRYDRPKALLSVIFFSLLILYPLYFRAVPMPGNNGVLKPEPLLAQQVEKYFADNFTQDCVPVFSEHTARVHPDLYFFLRNHDGLSGKGYPIQVKFDTSLYNNMLVGPAVAQNALKEKSNFSDKWPLFQTIAKNNYKKAVLILSGDEFTQLYRNSIFLSSAIGSPAKFVSVQGVNISWDEDVLFIVHIAMM